MHGTAKAEFRQRPATDIRPLIFVNGCLGPACGLPTVSDSELDEFLARNCFSPTDAGWHDDDRISAAILYARHEGAPKEYWGYSNALLVHFNAPWPMAVLIYFTSFVDVLRVWPSISGMSRLLRGGRG